MLGANLPVNPEYNPNEDGFYKILITCHTEENILSLINDLITPNNGIINRAVECNEYLYDNSFSSVFLLTEEEKKLVEKDSRVQQACYYPLPEGSLCYKLEQRLQPNRSTTNNSSFDNYALLRCCALSGSFNNLNSPVTGIYTYNYTGSGVDVVIVDTGIVADHPEWRSRFTGQSRLQRINWTLFYSLTSQQSQIASISDNSLLLNGISAGAVLCWNSRAYKNGSTIIGVPLNYTFNVDNINGFEETDKKFVISASLSGAPLTNGVTNNNSPNGDVILTANYASIPSTLYYYVTSTSENKIWGDSSNVITNTDYNTLNLTFYSDTNGHGTHCTGTVAGSAFGWAKEAHIHMMTSIDVGNGISSTQLYGLPLVLAWHRWKKTQPSLSARPTVCSNSWRIPGFLAQGPGYYYPEFADYNNVVKQMVDEGIHFVRAAGNENIIIVPFGNYLYDTVQFDSGANRYLHRIGTPGWPANEPTGPLYIVGASDVNMSTSVTSKLLERKVSFSTKGAAVTLFAPGTNIISSYPSGTLYRGGVFGNYYMTKLSGTSMACPQVAGWLATVLEQFPTATPAQMNAFIRSNAIMNTLLEISADDSYNGFSLASADNLFLYQYPAPQFFFKDMVDSLTLFDNPNKSLSYSVSGRFTNTSPITSMLYSTFSHTYSALSAAYINLSYSGL